MNRYPCQLACLVMLGVLHGSQGVPRDTATGGLLPRHDHTHMQGNSTGICHVGTPGLFRNGMCRPKWELALALVGAKLLSKKHQASCQLSRLMESKFSSSDCLAKASDGCSYGTSCGHHSC